MPARPRLTPAMADVRRAVRDALSKAIPDARNQVTNDLSLGTLGGWVLPADAPLVLVALSGGPDSLGLAAALAFEAAKCGVRAGAVIIDHDLQAASSDVAKRAAEQAVSLGLAPVVVERVDVVKTGDGPEADARSARYDALTRVAVRAGAVAVVLGHTLDDQAETVLLGLARGSGPRSLSGMPAVSVREDSRVLFVRPLLGIRRQLVAQSCVDQKLDPWIDPHNADARYARVRVRDEVLPVLEREMGPGIAEALARTASQLAEDSHVLETMAKSALNDCLTALGNLTVDALADLPTAVRRRVLHEWLQKSGSVGLTSAHIEAVDELITAWSGQNAVNVPNLRVARSKGQLTIDTN